MRSLTKRLTLLVIGLLCVCWTAAGFAFGRSMRRALESELQRRLAVRLAWLAASMAVDRVEGGQIKLHKRPDPDDAAEWWQVATPDGKILWESPRSSGGDGGRAGRALIGRATVLVFGDPALPVIRGADLRPREELVWEGVPPAVRAAAERAVPGLVPDRVDLAAAAGVGAEEWGEGTSAAYTIEGRDLRRQYLMTVDAAGRLLGLEPGRAVDPDATSLLPRWRLTGGQPGRIVLRLSARTSSASMEHELARMTWELETFGPLALLITGAVLAVSIRWQLRPLSRMAEETGRIGPGSSAERIGPVGSTAECAQLREAINGMLDRLAEALGREHRFAATAAHELRTPLAQLRTTIEVALRRDRDAAEYRAALVETLADVERLQKLVLGLLQLTRGTEHSAADGGRPVPLAALLQKARRDHGPQVAIVPGAEALGDDLAVVGDEDLFLAALGNVLENAARYAPGTPATIRVESAGDPVRVCVSDRGPGVPAADRERIFQPLTRLVPRRHEPGGNGDGNGNGNGNGAGAVDGEGFGLGLTVARASARAYGGDLSCRDRSDGAPGVEFVFSFRKAAPRD